MVSVELGHSFVIQRLGSDSQGNALWSGPCFGTISNVGVGVTAGANLPNHEAGSLRVSMINAGFPMKVA